MFGSKKKPSSSGTATPSGFENYMPAVISSLSVFFFNEESATPDDLLKFAKKNKSPLYMTLNDIIDSIPTIKQFEKSKIFTDIQKSVEKISLSVDTGKMAKKLDDSIFLLNFIAKESLMTNSLISNFPNTLNEVQILLSFESILDNINTNLSSGIILKTIAAIENDLTETYIQNDDIIKNIENLTAIVSNLNTIIDASKKLESLVTSCDEINNYLLSKELYSAITAVENGLTELYIQNDDIINGINNINESINNLSRITDISDKLESIISAFDEINKYLASKEIFNVTSAIENDLTELYVQNDDIINGINNINESLNNLSNITDTADKLESIISAFDEINKNLSTNLNAISTSLINDIGSILKTVQKIQRVSNNIAQAMNEPKRMGGVYSNIEKILNTLSIKGDLFNLLDENKKLLETITTEKNTTHEIIFSFNNAKDMTQLLNALDMLDDPEEKIEGLKKFFGMFKEAEKITNPDGVEKAVEGVKNAIFNIISIHLSEDFIEDLEDSIDDLTDIINDNYMALIDALVEFHKNARQISKIEPSFNYLNNAIKKVKETLDLLPSGKALFTAMLKIPMLVLVLTNLMKSINKLKIINKGINKAFDALETGADKINVIIGKLNANDPKDIDRAIKTAKQFRNLVIFSAVILIIAGILMTFVDIAGLFAFTGALLIFIGGMLFISKFLMKQQDSIDGAFNALKGLALLVAVSGLMLIFGGIMMNAIDVASLLKFSGILLGFIVIVMGTLIGVLLSSGKYAKDANDALRSMTKLVVVSGLLLLFAGILGSSLDFVAMIKFAGMLALFIAIVMGIYILASKFITKAIHVSKNFSLLILISGMTLVFGSMLMNFVSIGSLIKFVISYAIFMGIVAGTYIVMSRFIKKSIKVSKNFVLLIYISGMTLALGSLITKFVGIGDISLFTLMLGLFVGGIVTLFGLFGKRMKATVKIGKEFGYLVAITGLTLVLGGLITQWIDAGAITLFTALLLTMVSGIVAVFGVFGKKLKKSIKYAKQLGILVAIIGAVLLIGGLLFMLFPNLPKSTAQFTALMLALLGGVGLVVYLLGKLGNKLKKGLIAAGLIVVLSGLMAGVVAILANAVSGVDMAELWNGVGIMFTMILGLAGVSLGLGAILSNPFALLAMSIGTAFMAIMAGILMMVGTAVKDMAVALVLCATVGKSIDFGIISGMITNSVQLAEALSGFLPYADTMELVSDAAIAMSRALSKIAESVEDYASLKVPIYEGTKKVGYRSLNEKDFTSAAKNVSTVITVLGGAVISTYEKNPDMFKTEGAFAEYGLGSSKFDKVAKSLKKLGPLISSIAKGVKNYAELKVPIYEGTKTVGYKHLDEKDFSNAAKNVSLVITTLAGAIISTYDMNPEMFKIEGAFANLGFGSSKFDKVAKSLKVLGPLISSISEGIKDYAELKMPVSYNKDGSVKEYRALTSKDFFQAANNIGLVVTTISNALIQTYEKHKDMFKEPSGWFADSPFKIITESASDMAEVISNISEGIKDYVDLKIPTKYVDGKAVEWRQLESSDFKKAAKNIGTVIGTVGTALNDFYDSNEKLFDDEEDSKIFIILNAAKKMGDVIGSIADGIADYVEMLIPTKWDKDGKAIEFRPLERSDLKKASDNIGSIIGTIGSALIEFYNKNTDLFDDEEDSVMFFVLDAATKMGDMIGKISKGILSYATAQVPIEWDDKGNPINFAMLDEKAAENAANQIGIVIGTIGGALKTFYDTHEDLFDDEEDSVMFLVLDAATQMGDMLGTISKAIVSYASAQVPIAWDKEGNPIKFELIDSGRLESAGTTIGNVIGSVGGALIKFYEDHKNDIFKEGEDSTFFRVLEASTNLGEMIKSIADGIVAYAGAQIPIKWNEKGEPIEFMGLDETVTTNAADNIKNVIETVGGAIVNLYDMNPEMFDDPMFGDNAFTRTLNACIQMSDMITKIMEGVISYAIFRFPKSYDKDGNIVEYFENQDKFKVINDATSSIEQVITGVGGAIQKIYDGNEDMFEPGIFDRDTKFNRVITSVTKMGGMLASLALGLSYYAGDTIPVNFDENGKPLSDDKSVTGLSGLATKAADTVETVMSTVGTRLLELGDKYPEFFDTKWWEEENDFSRVMTSCSKMGNMIANIGSGLKSFASLKLPIYDEKGNITGYEEISDTLLQAVPGIVSTIVSDIGNALLNLSKGDLFKSGGEIISEMMTSCGNMGNFVAKIGKQVASIARLEIPEFDKNGKQTDTHKIKPEELSKAGKNIKAVLTAMVDGFNFTGDEVKKIDSVNEHANDASSAFTSCLNILGIIAEGYKSSASQISVFNKLFDKNNELTSENNIFPKISNFIGSIINTFYSDENEKSNDEGKGAFKKLVNKIINIMVDKVKTTSVINAINNSYEIISAFNEFWEEFNNTITKSIIPSVNNKSLWESLEIFNNNREKVEVFFKSIKSISDIASAGMNADSFVVLSELCEYLPNIFNAINDLSPKIKAISKLDFEIEEKEGFLGLSKVQVIKNIPAIMESLSYIANSTSELAKINGNNFAVVFALPEIIGCITRIGNNFQYISKLNLGKTIEQSVSTGMFTTEDVQIIENAVILTNTTKYILDEFIPKLADNKDDVYDAKASVSALGGALTDISKMFNEVFESISFSAFEGTDTSIFDTLMKHVKHMFEEFTNLAKSNSSVKYKFLLSQIKDLRLISENINVISLLYSLTEPNNIIGFISLVTKINDTIKPALFPYWGITKNAEYLSEYASHIYDISNLYGAISEKYIERFLKDVTDINLLIDTFNTESIENLDNEAKSLGKYVKGVNELQLNKADKLIKMVDTMNKLASNIGNLDDFAQHLVNDFGEVVERLTQQIDEAKQTMVTLDTREEERRKKLQEYIEHINEIMSNKLTVEITQATEETVATPGGGGEGLPDEEEKDVTPGGGTEGSKTSSNEGQGPEAQNNVSTERINTNERKVESTRRSSRNDNVAASIAEAMKGLVLRKCNGGYKFE